MKHNVVRHIRGNISKWKERFHVDEDIRAKKARRWRERLEALANYNLKYAKHRGHSMRRDETYDAFFCADCNTWIESACSDPGCEVCPSRPVKPDTDGMSS